MKALTAADLIVIQGRSVDNPSYTDGLYYADTGATRDRNMRVDVAENAMTRLGALCFVKAASRDDQPDLPGKRYPFHERTAERFKGEYEALFGAGVPAFDNTRPVVDTSLTAHDSGIAARIDRGASMRHALDHLGPHAANVLIDFLVLCTPCEAYAAKMPSGQPNQRQVRALIEERLSILRELAKHWDYLAKAA